MENFILRIPEWQGELAFSRDLLVLIATILLAVIGILFCFSGYKYFQTVVLMLLSCGVYCLGYLTSVKMTQNLVLRLFVSTLIAFIGICLLYFASVLVGFMVDRSKTKKFLLKCIIPFSAMAGGVVLAVDIYSGIYRSAPVAGLTAAAFAGAGMAVQYKNRKKQINFKTYDDLLKLQPLDTEEQE
ncbi:MAG: hypothetical protein HFI57_14915 [Lachnospiraceae bacterium]|nr:hypothetical protein [Lachnospiraceae bacterium]